MQQKLNAYKTGQNLAAEIIYWVNRIEIFPPFKHEGQNCILDTLNNCPTLYMTATCDQLRHGATNYEDELLSEIKATGYSFTWKEAILNTVKYDATRRAFKAQHAWILKEAAVDQQSIKNLETEIAELQQKARDAVYRTSEYRKLYSQYIAEKTKREERAKMNLFLNGKIQGQRRTIEAILRKAEKITKEEILNKLVEMEKRLAINLKDK